MRSRRREHHHDRGHLPRLRGVMLILMRVRRSNLLMECVAVVEHMVLDVVAPHMEVHHTVEVRHTAVQLIVRQLKSQYNIGIRRGLAAS